MNDLLVPTRLAHPTVGRGDSLHHITASPLYRRTITPLHHHSVNRENVPGPHATVAKGRIGSAPDHHPTRGYSPAQSTDCTAQPNDRNGPQELLSRFSTPIQQRSNTPKNRITHAPSMACPTANRTLYAVTHCPYAKSIAKHPLKSLTRVLRNDRSQDPMSQPANCLSQRSRGAKTPCSLAVIAASVVIQ